MNVPRIAFVLSGALLIVSLWDLVIAEPQKPAEPGVPPPAAGPKASPPGGRPSIVESYEEARERERLEMEGARSLLARLLRQRQASAESQLDFAEALHKEGRVPVTSVLFARQQVALAELDLAGNAHQRVAAHEKIVNIALETESTMKASGAAGVSTGGANYEFARSARLQAQAELIRECVNA